MTPPPAPRPYRFHSLARFALRALARSGFRPGHAYSVIERHGPRLAGVPLSARLADGSRVTCLLDEHIQRHMYFFGEDEPIEAYLFRAMCRPGMTVMDLGANVGQYTLLAARKVGPGGRVHAFEPIPANFERLTAHVAANGFGDRVSLNRAAAWSHAGTFYFHLEPGDAEDNKTNYGVGVEGRPADVLKVDAVALDEYVERVGVRWIDLIKLDIEGAELFALRGMARSLPRHSPRPAAGGQPPPGARPPGIRSRRSKTGSAATGIGFGRFASRRRRADRGPGSPASRPPTFFVIRRTCRPPCCPADV